MSICLPNLRSTSVFKVYYGGTGQTSLTQGGVVIGNGINAVQCITGSEGQVLTWDSVLNTWTAKDPTGGNGSGGGNVPDIVITPSNNTPTTVFKKIFSNTSRNNKNNLIDWSNNSSGSFRICNYNNDRKYVTIYNDSSEYDLYISIANDENSKIEIDFEDKNDINDINIKYVFLSSSAGSLIEKKLFEYGINDIKNIHSYHTHSEEPLKKYGYNKNYSLSYCDNKAKLIINLTPDFYSQNLNKYLDETIISGSFIISLSNSAGVRSSNEVFKLSSSMHYPEFHNLQYNIYTKISSSTFQSSSFTTSSTSENMINGFNLSDINSINYKTTPPEEFSYIVYAEESLTISENECVLPIFGYYKHPKTNNETLTARVTEAI